MALVAVGSARFAGSVVSLYTGHRETSDSIDSYSDVRIYISQADCAMLETVHDVSMEVRNLSAFHRYPLVSFSG